jgi:hypothetical protein
MRFTWRDGISTLLAAVVLLLAFAVVRGWNWPLLGGYRSGMIALAVVGLVMSGIGTAAREVRWSDPFMATEGILGAVAVVLFVVGIIAATQGWLVAFTVSLMVVWFVAVTRHVVEHEPAGPAHPVTR